MEELKELFLKKCQDVACEPLQALLDDLSAAISTGEILTTLRLNGNSKRLFNKRVDYMQAFALCEALYDDVNIQEIDLSYNRLNDTAAASISRLIKMSKNLLRVNLAGNEITSAGAAALAEALSQDGVCLQELNLSGNNLEDDGVMALGDMLRKNRSLLMLNLQATGFGIKGIIRVCSALGAEGDMDGPVNSTLCSLDIGNPTLRSGPQETTTLSISRMLASNSTIAELGLSKHQLTDAAFDTLVTYGLLRNSSISYLDLRANKLSGFSGPNLERLLNDVPHLSILDLSHNNLGDAGALSIARCLPYVHWLTRLDLRNNNLGEQGLVALAESLALASSLQVILLWGNNFGPSACRAFFDTLTQASSPPVSDLAPYEVDGRAQVALREASLLG